MDPLALLGIVIAVTGTMNGLMLWAVKTMLDQRTAEITGKIDSALSRAEDVERKLLEFKAEMPRDYVRREDNIRNISVIDAKLDRMNTTFEALREKVAERLLAPIGGTR